MRFRSLPTLTAIALVIGVALAPPGAQASRALFDVAVYGGTPAGVLAAYTAARAGASVVLVEPTRHIGGMMASGLSWTDYGDRATIGGYAKLFFDRTQRAEGIPDGRYHFQPHTAERVFLGMIRERRITLIRGEPLRESGGVTVKAARISELRLAGRADRRIRARVFVDASYEGDLMAQAGVSYRLGREARSTYNESLAGAQAPRYVTTLSDGADPGPTSPPPGAPGSADARLQDSNFRICFSSDPANQVPLPKPATYSPGDYDLLDEYLADRERRSGEVPKLSWVLTALPLVNRKFDVNATSVVSHSLPGLNWSYPEASYAERRSIDSVHRTYAMGFLWFLANDPRSPTSVREEMTAYGLCADEFTDNGNWPWRLYLREGRRMVGRYTLTQHDIETRPAKTDIIGIASYRVDSHYVSRWVDAERRVWAEGWIELPYLKYAIPYRSITPRETEATNLLVPVAASASHVAYTSLRMEPQYMIMGEAAGQAAAIAAEMAMPVVQRVSYRVLAARLKAHGAYLTNPPADRASRTVIPPRSGDAGDRPGSVPND